MRKLLTVSLVSLVFSACGCDPQGTQTATGELQVPENSLDFGQACPRPSSDDLKVESVVRTVTLKNVGVGDLTLNRFEVEAGKQELFEFDTTKVAPGTVIPGITDLPVDITFVPNAAGTIVADLIIEGDDANEEPIVVKLIGEGRSAPPDPGVVVNCLGGWFDNDPNDPNDTCSERDPETNLEKLRVEPKFWFRDAPIGEVAVATFKVRNNGCPILEITGITVTTDESEGADPATFKLFEGQKDNLQVISGGEAEIKVAFNPKLSNSFKGVLSFNTNDPKAKTVSISLTGVGIEPQIVAEPTGTCDFRKFGAEGCSGLFSLRNAGEHELVINDIFLEKASANAAAPSNFRIDGRPAAGTALAPHGRLVDAIKVEYTPHLEAEEADYLVVSTTGGQARVLLRGGSFPVLYPTPEHRIDFGTNLSPTETQYKKVEILNFATYAKQLPLTIKSITETEDAANVFEIVTSPVGECPAAPAPGTQLPVGQSTSFCVKYTPPAIGGESVGAIVIDTDDPRWAKHKYTMDLYAKAICNASPQAEITVPTDTTCGVGQPCSGGAVCIGGFCHATGSYAHSLADGTELELSCAAAHDLVPDASGSCVVPDYDEIATCQWSVIPPGGSSSTIDPQGPTPQRYTTLKIDPSRTGTHIVQLRVTDKTGRPSTQASFNVIVQP